ncbi:helix-turn-helix domain-containing protein [Rhizobium sullae]|uniref:helix-turn-helix domain-containing protein n=1 Tax=Rhizobium sullae TaxID=50338 RepID=UPI0010464DAC|nr:helix-turn-helix transcriptional regulator [Rhizobium sullae]
MALVIIEMEAKTPHDWRANFIQTYGIPTTLVDAPRLQQPRSLSGFVEKAFIEKHVIDVCQNTVATGRPDFSKIDATIRDIRLVCSRLILPDPSGSGRWCIVLAQVHAISHIGRPARFDDTDLSILQLLREGLSAREIGAALKLSPRTIEHRIERMKIRTGIGAIVQLLAAAS